jgi:hypothetical protein
MTNKKIIQNRPRKMSISISESTSYEKDFFKWTNDQSKLLKKREFSKLDIDNLIEEIESLGRSEKRQLQSYLENLLMHMLKAKFQPKMKTVSWDLSIREAKHKAQLTLQDNPSLKSKLKAIVKDAYFSARLKAALETKLEEKIFPKECPWELKDIFPGLKDKHY